ncbi:MAG: hypothetical protein HOQ24_05375 [Mycobacteriaceae bacterium]|nr:hypothetical protein [Mycobacteriaceae bacterium]
MGGAGSRCFGDLALAGCFGSASVGFDAAAILGAVVVSFTQRPRDSAVVNTGRELSGLLGVTVIGAILTTRSAAVHDGTPLHAFLVGYRFALVIAAAIVAVCAPIALWTLRSRRPAPPQRRPRQRRRPTPPDSPRSWPGEGASAAGRNFPHLGMFGVGTCGARH